MANSLIIGALAISPAALWENKWAALAMLSAGLLISAAWLGITVQAWSAIRGMPILPENSPRPLQASAESARRDPLRPRADKIHHLVLLVIAVFMLMYLGLGYIRFALV